MATGVGPWIPCPGGKVVNWCSNSRGIVIPRAASARRNEPASLKKKQWVDVTPNSLSINRYYLPKKMGKKKSKARLITVSTSDGRWHGKWECDYLFTLQDLGLKEFAEDVNKDADVYISLCIHKHAGLGLSVDGRIRTSFTAKCCNCCTPFLREINAPFKAWILSSTRKIKEQTCGGIPTIVEEDPCVVLVKPGYEADLDPLIQDTTRLALSVDDSCSESCDKSEPELQYMGVKNAASTDKRWYKLLELKNKNKGLLSAY